MKKNIIYFELKDEKEFLFLQKFLNNHVKSFFEILTEMNKREELEHSKHQFYFNHEIRQDLLFTIGFKNRGFDHENYYYQSILQWLALKYGEKSKNEALDKDLPCIKYTSKNKDPFFLITEKDNIEYRFKVDNLGFLPIDFLNNIYKPNLFIKTIHKLLPLKKLDEEVSETVREEIIKLDKKLQEEINKSMISL